MDDQKTLRTFLAVRPRLFGIAYRMLGSAAEAEDVVQETWLRWQGADRDEVREPAAFLATAVTRLAINVAQSARARREAYVGPWLPEPIDTAATPETAAERADTLSLAMLLLLESLNPVERAAYVLREAFDYPYPQIAEIAGVSEANARQLVSRARKHVAAGRRVAVPAQQHRRLLETFLEAARRGNIEALERLLAADAVSWSDGGGKVRGLARRPVTGRDTVARFVASFATRFWTGVSIGWIEANGAPAATLIRDGVRFGVLSADVDADGIHQLQWQMNPDKLGA